MGNNFGKKYILFFRIFDKDQLRVGSRIGRINQGSSITNESMTLNLIVNNPQCNNKALRSDFEQYLGQLYYQ